jgi:hypothetical protein
MTDIIQSEQLPVGGYLFASLQLLLERLQGSLQAAHTKGRSLHGGHTQGQCAERMTPTRSSLWQGLPCMTISKMRLNANDATARLLQLQSCPYVYQLVLHLVGAQSSQELSAVIVPAHNQAKL